MLAPTLSERFEEILDARNISSDNLKKVDRETIDELCEELGINLLEKAYILGFDPKLVFTQDFLDAIVFLELDSDESDLELWRNILNIKAS